MKKNMFLVLLLMVCCLGCTRVSPKPKKTSPPSWDVNKDVAWGIIGQGEITQMGYVRNPTCDKSPVCASGCLKHGSYNAIRFDNGSMVKYSKTLNPKQLEIGANGKLYQYDNGASLLDSWFQFILTPEKKPPIKPKEKSPTTVTKNIEIPKEVPQIKYAWKSTILVNPPKHQIVLIKFKNGIAALAHLNDENEWKSELSRNKIQGGRTLNDVVEWKEIDLN